MMRPYYRYIEENLASSLPKTREKERSYILIQSHIIEKGLSLAEVKPWFGQPKIAALISNVKDYYKNYGDKKLLYWVVSMLQVYMDFNAHYDGAPTTIIEQFDDLSRLLGDFKDESLKGGFVEVTNQNDFVSTIDFEKFARSRHSVRSFTGESIDIQLLHKALKIAETTPSACNRQPWYNYVVTNKKEIVDLLTIQRGSRQFKETVSALVVTCSSAHFFGNDEYNQMYFNTGLYAMNLLYALHSEGLGTIPLNMGIGDEDLSKIRVICRIPDSQMPISLIAVGILPERYKYAKSARFSYKDYTKFV
jgi:nitroreductase